MSMEDLKATTVRIDRVMRAHPHEILSIAPHDTVLSIAGEYARLHSGIAMVCDVKDHLIGVVSLGDIVHAISQHGPGALNMPVRMIMTSNVVTCEPTEDVESALDKMAKRGVAFLPVVVDGKLTGIIDKESALETLYDEASLDFTQLRNYVFKTGGRY